MSQLVAVRLDEPLLADVDRERHRRRMTRAAAVKEALRFWVERRRHEAAVRRDQEGYQRHPVGDDEFSALIGAQTWPR